MTRSRISCLAISCLALAAIIGLAASAGAETPAPDPSTLSDVQQQLDSSKARQQELAQDVTAAIEAQEEISRQLVSISQKVQQAEATISSSEDELLKLAKERALILASLGERQDVLSELLAGLQRLQQNPPPALVVEPGDVLAALRGAMVLGVIVPELRQEADRLAQNLERLQELETAIRQRKDSIGEEIARLKASQAELATLIERKKELVESGNAELDQEKKRAAELAKQAKSLKQLLASLAEEKARSEAERQKQAKADEAARKAKEEALARPRMAFGDARGKLAYPAQGDILRRFGEDDGLGGTVRGLYIATRDKAQVTAPADGEVEFSGPFRSYGQVLILNTGGGYHVLLAGLDKVTAETGEFLRSGEPVGEMGDGPASVTLLGDLVQENRPVLYIEFRDSNEAIDSGPWWIGGMKEARG